LHAVAPAREKRRIAVKPFASGRSRPTLHLAVWVALAVILSPADLLAADSSGRIEVHVTGFRTSGGELLALLFASPEGFPGDDARALQRFREPLRAKSAIAVFRNVPAGVYAVVVCHDEDADGDCDKNMLGIPIEGIGVSNNALRRFGPPRFSDAQFPFRSSEVSLRVQLVY
jgi:uncharacterized protein (DUF2141 family)